MKKTTSMISSLLMISGLTVSTVFAEEKNELNIYQVMQQVLVSYPTLKMSTYEVEQARLQKQQIESNLGWILDSSAGMSHDLSGLGAPSDRIDVNASISRMLKSGGSLSLNGAYSYEDSSFVINPFPNPAHKTRLDISYRLPLSQGFGNPVYNQGLISARASLSLAQAGLLQTKIALAEQVKNLFYSAAATRARLNNAQQAVERTIKLETFVNKNSRLGLSELQDQLQVKAQLNTKQTELSTLKILWQQQNTALNRLMSRNWDKQISPKLINKIESNKLSLQNLLKKTKKYHPAISIGKAKLQIAESQLKIEADYKKDNLDLVMSVGSRTSTGNNATSSVSEEDYAGSVRLEYKHLFDDRGVSSKFKQAQFQRHIALQEMKKVDDDVDYTVSGLVAEINAAAIAVDKAEQQLNSEDLKLQEAVRRYRNGRLDTAQLIQFLNENSFSKLAYQTQKIELNNRIVALQIMTGKFWTRLAARNGEKK